MTCCIFVNNTAAPDVFLLDITLGVPDTNIALGKPTWQISDESHDSAAAVDGDDTMCTMTSTQSSSFWAVDLGAIVIIREVLANLDDIHGDTSEVKHIKIISKNVFI